MANNDSVDTEFDGLFEDLINEGYLEEEFEINKKLKIKLRILDTGEQLKAQNIEIANRPFTPRDVIERERIVSKLCYAITEITSNEKVFKVYYNEDTKKTEQCRKSLVEKLKKLPPYLIDSMYDKYIELTEKQKNIYENFEENVENF